MAVSASDFIQPVGRVYASWFPDEDLTANIVLWLSQASAITPGGASEAESDAVAVPYVYWRAFDAKFWALAGSPDSATLEGVGARTITAQRVWFSTQSKLFGAQYAEAIAAIGAVEVLENSGDFRPSVSTPVTVVF